MTTFNAAFTRSIIGTFGEEGRNWLDALPEILERCRDHWDLTFSRPATILSLNYVTFAHTKSGDEVVLKVGVPHSELFTEMEALRHYAGSGIVKCLDSDNDLGALLLESVRPGTMLYELGDNASQTRLAGRVMADLARPAPANHSLPTFADWIERGYGDARRIIRDESGFLKRSMIDHAQALFEWVQASKVRDVLLHGDLHHENILLSEERGWIAIDPKGVIGAPCLEAGRYLINQIPADASLDHKRALLVERVPILSRALAAPEDRIRAAGVIDGVLSISWGLSESEPEGMWQRNVRDVAVLLSDMTD